MGRAIKFRAWDEENRRCAICGSVPSFINGEWSQCSSLYCGNGGWYHEKCKSQTTGTMYDIAFPTWNGDIEVWENNIPQSETILLPPWADKEPVLMQFTGLHDNNGKEIYEGDIITCRATQREIHDEIEKGEIIKVEYREGYFYPFGYNAGWRSEVWDIEVIGNIYENPDLLTEGKA